MLRIWLETDIVFPTIRAPDALTKERLPERGRFLWGHVRIDPMRPKINGAEAAARSAHHDRREAHRERGLMSRTETTIRLARGRRDIKRGRPGASERLEPG
jgi:hypothetical protein